MNKQQLASRIWEAANQMRSKMEANEYKDYILGFIFYKFLSDREERYLLSLGATEEEIREIREGDDVARNTQANIGYFIEHGNLFSTWLSMGNDFTIENVRDALSAFDRLINRTHRKVFDKIFLTLETGLHKLGESAQAQSRAARDLIYLIKDIPMDEQSYDVLGFVYEYLISNFAANAGKKAGEFYTPHEVSEVMSEIVAYHLRDCGEIKIYDPTSGSGSLLISIGKSIAARTGGDDRIKYYAQELKENTYNLTRMNLVMRGVKPDNIVARCGDTLGRDWPWFDEADPDGTYEPMTNLDAVVSNPPYSQRWDPGACESDPRFQGYGLAPKTKADYAFLLHDLYHLRQGGIMTIVLPHGVLFRGGEEGKIRKNLIENNNIDAVIGLPANIFFGTGIPTIIMVLKKGRPIDDLLIIDASREYTKDGKNNKLRARDIKKITDTYISRAEIPGYSRRVSRGEIRENDYNLNIPRYVDSGDRPESTDIYASMFGGIPGSELDALSPEFEAFPFLKGELFSDSGAPYLSLACPDVRMTIEENGDVAAFREGFRKALSGFDDYLKAELVDGAESVAIAKGEAVMADELFRRLEGIPLVDRYDAYQTLDDAWGTISADLEMIQSEGFSAVTQTDPLMVTKKRDGQVTEVQDGWTGHILPFGLVQEEYLSDELEGIASLRAELEDISSRYGEFIDAIPEDEAGDLISEDGASFVPKEVEKAYKEISGSSVSPEKGSVDDVVVSVYGLMKREKELKSKIKNGENALRGKTMYIMGKLSKDEARSLLAKKWITPVMDGIFSIPDSIICGLESRVSALAKKYDVTLASLDRDIKEAERSLADMIDDLDGDEYDLMGLREFQKILRGE